MISLGHINVSFKNVLNAFVPKQPRPQYSFEIIAPA